MAILKCKSASLDSETLSMGWMRKQEEGLRKSAITWRFKLILDKLIRFARKSPREQSRIIRHRLLDCWSVPRWRVPHAKNDRTAYVIGLFGSGRWYINQLLMQHIGGRANYFRDMVRFHPHATSMIYTSHATLKHVSMLQHPPPITELILEAVSSGIADLIFVYRHPLDSLLTNWIWWRTYLRENRWTPGISKTYLNVDDLCADLDRNFFDFQAFAQGDPDYFAGEPGPRFLSFAEFVEETEIHFRSATLA